jgi:hypothetical protein
VAWVDPETGERELWFRRRNGESVDLSKDDPSNADG